MASDTQLSGLDALELVPVESPQWWRKAWASLWPKALAVALVLGVWQMLFVAEIWDEWALPSPASVITDLTGYVQQSQFWGGVEITMKRAVLGFAYSVVLGTLIGVAVARFRVLRAAVGSLITGLQTLPSIIWFPFAILLLGLSEKAIYFVVILGATPSIANGLISGIDYVPPAWKRVGTVLGMRGLTLYRHVILPASLPSFISGLKQGWAFSWRSLMAGELLVLIPGYLSVGVLMSGARELHETERLISWIIVVLIIGILVDIAFGFADNALRRRWGLNQS